ncbi:PAS domain-containing protein [Nisaea acidiphila]|uniref:PAS domain-containing protein n=1 Tax=Nisaea acidiphila TaxID=1862145 RepID=A0A9J7ALA5_9PROT|nr:PAS domain-containing protein [Nisaea acidiphila]UUX48435.1 PAS domain-containing protein [Nisaea acidiphila]
MTVPLSDNCRWNAVIGADTALTNKQAGRILAYWNDLRGDRMAPPRSEVDPLDLFDFLPHLAMIKTADRGGDFQFSLIGTGLSKIYGLVTRQMVSQVDCWEPTREALEEGLRLCAAAKAPVHGEWGRMKTLKNVDVDIEVVLLPISEDGAEVSRILGFHIMEI